MVIQQHKCLRKLLPAGCHFADRIFTYLVKVRVFPLTYYYINLNLMLLGHVKICFHFPLPNERVRNYDAIAYFQGFYRSFLAPVVCKVKLFWGEVILAFFICKIHVGFKMLSSQFIYQLFRKGCLSRPWKPTNQDKFLAHNYFIERRECQ